MHPQRTAIVFGGAGFIGSALLATLQREGCFTQLISADLYPPARALDGVRYEACDVRNPITLTGAFGEVEIFNFAAVHTTPGHPDWEYFWTNLNGAIEICRFAERVGCRHITFTSSISVYGTTEAPRDEKGPMQPDSAYGRSKLLAERIHEQWQTVGDGRQLIVVRPAVIFGQGERGNFTRLAKALRGHRFAFPGRDDAVKACAYVGELVRSMLFARSLALPLLTYNMAYPRAYTARDICDAFHSVAGFAKPRMVVPLWLMMFAGWVFELAAALGLKTSVNRARVAKLVRSTNIVPGRLQELGYQYETDLAEGLRRWQDESAGTFT